MKKKIRAIQYGVGPIGASIARLMREKSAIEICGAIDNDPFKAGQDLGEVVGAADAPWGVKISADPKEVLEQAADVVIHSTSSALPKVMDQLLACLEAESCIVSTCEELSYPYRTYPELAAKLDSTAKDWGVALIGTGVNPGFVMDKLVVTLAAVSQRIEHAKAVRIVNASQRRLPLQRKIGAGMTVDEFREKVSAGVIKHVGLPESVAMIADSLNLQVDQITETIEPVVANEEVRTDFLTVDPGQAAGVHQIARGLGRKLHRCRGSCKNGRGYRSPRCRSASAHARAGLHGPGRLENHRRRESRRENSGDRQRRYSNAGGRRAHGGGNRLRRRHDWTRSRYQSVDFCADGGVSGDTLLSPANGRRPPPFTFWLLQGNSLCESA